MTATDSARHALYAELERVLGSEHAKTLMTHLPQHPSGEAVTQADLTAFERRLDDRFTQIDDRFNRIDGRFTQIDGRFTQIDDRFTQIDDRFTQIDARFTQIDDRFDRMEARFDRMEARFDHRLDRLDERMDRMMRFYVATTVGSMTALTAIFTLVAGFFT